MKTSVKKYMLKRLFDIYERKRIAIEEQKTERGSDNTRAAIAEMGKELQNLQDLVMFKGVDDPMQVLQRFEEKEF